MTESHDDGHHHGLEHQYTMTDLCELVEKPGFLKTLNRGSGLTNLRRMLHEEAQQRNQMETLSDDGTNDVTVEVDQGYPNHRPYQANSIRDDKLSMNKIRIERETTIGTTTTSPITFHNPDPYKTRKVFFIDSLIFKTSLIINKYKLYDMIYIESMI